MTDPTDWNAEVIAEFRANNGTVAAPYDNHPPMLLIHTIVVHTGIERVTPMRGRPGDGGWYIFASAHGSERNPGWYHNIVANPEIEIEIGTETIPVHARIVEGEERDRIFAVHAADFPVFADYQSRLTRTIPVVHLTPR